MRVIISAGGTGGHIYPALAIINKLKDQYNNIDILYIGTTDRMEKDIIPSKGIEYIGLEMNGLSKTNMVKNIKSVNNFYNAYKKTKEIIKEFKPDIVLGIGGYITAPVIYAAHKMKIKTFIHEQNIIPGKSNRFLSKFVDKIGVSLPDSLTYFPKDKVTLTGNPRGEEAYQAKPIRKRTLGLKENKKLVLIVMGSLGSLTMSKKIQEILPKFNHKSYEVILITGKDYYDQYKNLLVRDNVKIFPFLDNILNVLKVTDLIVSRAGASTLAEITAIGLPSILVPSPYVANNHQYLNALSIKEAGGAMLLEEKDFNSHNLIKMIDDILNHQDKYLKLKTNMAKLGITNSTDRIIKIINSLVGEKDERSN
ncbi:MAG: undecaprenyldiphospho-muramoylpentapeptide beta-N-acetylglucosaminyltransferase [Tenericutes bacterium]|nr:undecaprenyldiphospho-muramoylpentapeptide beta-N-acetylglucosaminyltransferase [Mycoplasmatota bacterium]